MPTNLQIRRGLQSALPTGLAGEPLFTTDTKRLYISDGTTTNLLQGASSLLTTGAIPFSDANGKLTMNASSFYWDNTNSRLGIGTASPVSSLHVQGNYAGVDDNLIPQLRFQNSNTTSNVSLFALAKVLVGNGFGGGFPEIWLQAHRDSGNTGSTALRVVSNHPLQLWTNNTERLRIFANGNVGIGTTTDAGFKLDVNGTARVSATGSYNTTFANTGISVYNTYAPTGYNSWLIGVETEYFAVYSGRNIFYIHRTRTNGNSYLNTDYFRFGSANAATAQVDIESSSTTRASLRIRSGVAPTTPNDGDIWYDGTNIKMRIGGVTKTFTLI